MLKRPSFFQQSGMFVLGVAADLSQLLSVPTSATLAPVLSKQLLPGDIPQAELTVQDVFG